jgi:hypothetical protein
MRPSRMPLSSRGPRVALASSLALAALWSAPGHAEDMASVVARARDQVEKASYADALKTLAGLPDKGLPKALALEAALLEANAALVVKGDAAAQAACAKAVVVADFDPDVGPRSVAQGAHRVQVCRRDRARRSPRQRERDHRRRRGRQARGGVAAAAGERERVELTCVAARGRSAALDGPRGLVRSRARAPRKTDPTAAPSTPRGRAPARPSPSSSTRKTSSAT